MGLCREMGKEDREGERGGRDGEEIGKERQRERASFCRKFSASLLTCCMKLGKLILPSGPQSIVCKTGGKHGTHSKTCSEKQLR
jgi:hypothetical protein